MGLSANYKDLPLDKILAKLYPCFSFVRYSIFRRAVGINLP